MPRAVSAQIAPGRTAPRAGAPAGSEGIRLIAAEHSGHGPRPTVGKGVFHLTPFEQALGKGAAAVHHRADHPHSISTAREHRADQSAYKGDDAIDQSGADIAGVLPDGTAAQGRAADDRPHRRAAGRHRSKRERAFRDQNHRRTVGDKPQRIGGGFKSGDHLLDIARAALTGEDGIRHDTLTGYGNHLVKDGDKRTDPTAISVRRNREMPKGPRSGSPSNL